MSHLHLFNRLLAASVGLLVALGGGFVVAAASGWIQADPSIIPTQVVWAADQIRGLPGMAMFWTAAAGLVALVLGFILMYVELRVPAKSRELTLSTGQEGILTVSLPGLRRLAVHVIHAVDTVESVQAEVRRSRLGLVFTCRVGVRPEAAAPTVALEIRERLGEAVNHHLGRGAARIHIHTFVVEHAAGGKKRVV